MSWDDIDFDRMDQQSLFYVTAPLWYFFFIYGMYRLSLAWVRHEFFYDEFNKNNFELTIKKQIWCYVKYTVIVSSCVVLLVYRFHRHPHGILFHCIKILVTLLVPMWRGIYDCFKKIKSMTGEEIKEYAWLINKSGSTHRW
jgi:hypothetical protein